MVFENGVKNIQAAAYNGARTVYQIRSKDPVVCAHILVCAHVRVREFACDWK